MLLTGPTVSEDWLNSCELTKSQILSIGFEVRHCPQLAVPLRIASNFQPSKIDVPSLSCLSVRLSIGQTMTNGATTADKNVEKKSRHFK